MSLSAPAARAQACTGDCNGDGMVSINELTVGVNIALGGAPVSQCMAMDANADGTVSINELIAAVGNALSGQCQQAVTHVTGSCARPASGHGRFAPCADGTVVRAYSCTARNNQCVAGADRQVLASGQVAGGQGMWDLAIPSASITAGTLLEFEADVDQGVVYRTLDFGPVGAQLRGGATAEGVPAAPTVQIDPVTEASVRLIEQNGLQNFSNDEIGSLFTAVEQATADVSFTDLSAADAASKATDVAAQDPTVMMVIENAVASAVLQVLFRADDGSVYQVIRGATVAPALPAEARITTLGGSTNGIGGCHSSSATPGDPLTAVAGVNPIGGQTLFPYNQIVRTEVLQPNDISSVGFDSAFGGRVTLGTGAGALSICKDAFDCMGAVNVQPTTGLSSSTGAVPAACIANGVAANCEVPVVRDVLAFGLPASGSPPECDNPQQVTVNSSVCGAPPADGFTLPAESAIVFIYDSTRAGIGFSIGVAGFGVSPAALGQCSANSVVSAFSRQDVSVPNATPISTPTGTPTLTSTPTL